jgi:hypothetical protein
LHRGRSEAGPVMHMRRLLGTAAERTKLAAVQGVVPPNTQIPLCILCTVCTLSALVEARWTRCSKSAEHHPSRERTSGSAGRVSSGWRATNEGTGTTKGPSTKSAKRDGESAITNPTNGMNVGSRNCGHWFDRFADPFLRVMRGFRGMAKLAVTRRIERAGQTRQIAYRCSL